MLPYSVALRLNREAYLQKLDAGVELVWCGHNFAGNITCTAVCCNEKEDRECNCTQTAPKERPIVVKVN